MSNLGCPFRGAKAQAGRSIGGQCWVEFHTCTLALVHKQKGNPKFKVILFWVPGISEKSFALHKQPDSSDVQCQSVVSCVTLLVQKEANGAVRCFLHDDTDEEAQPLDKG